MEEGDWLPLEDINNPEENEFDRINRLAADSPDEETSYSPTEADIEVSYLLEKAEILTHNIGILNGLFKNTVYVYDKQEKELQNWYNKSQDAREHDTEEIFNYTKEGIEKLAETYSYKIEYGKPLIYEDKKGLKHIITTNEYGYWTLKYFSEIKDEIRENNKKGATHFVKELKGIIETKTKPKPKPKPAPIREQLNTQAQAQPVPPPMDNEPSLIDRQQTQTFMQDETLSEILDYEREEIIQPDSQIPLKERLKLLFKIEGVGPGVLITAVVMIFTSLGLGIYNAVKKTIIPTPTPTPTPSNPNSIPNKVKDGLKQLAKYLWQLSKKSAAAIPGIIGSIVSFLLKTMGNLSLFLAEHVLLFLFAAVSFIIYGLIDLGKKLFN